MTPAEPLLNPTTPLYPEISPTIHAWMRIDLAEIVANYRTLAGLVKPAVCSAVIKADAYGMGALMVGQALFEAGCRDFFVAYLDEGIALRQILPATGPDATTIYILNGYFSNTESDFIEHSLIPVLGNLNQINQWRSYGHDKDLLLPAAVHVDTGMTRNGLPDDELITLRDDPRLLQGIQVKLILSQMVFSDTPTNPMHERQLHRFQQVRHILPAAPASLSKSSTIFLDARYHYHLVRPGIALYGANQAFNTGNSLRPVLDLYARIYQIQQVKKDQPVGYNSTHTCQKPGRVATLALGYADGYPWSLANTGFVTIAGYRAPIIGRISMDMITVDISEIPESLCHEGSWAQIIGDSHTVDQLAAYAKTTPYEILLRLGKRYKRVYG